MEVATPTKFKQTKAGRIPIDWKTTRVSTIGQIVGGGTPDTRVKNYWNGDIAWCTPTDITSLKGYKYVWHTSRQITQDGLRNSSAQLLPAASLILCSRATIGDCAISTVPLATNQGFKSIVPNESIDIQFLYYLFCTLKKRLISISNGSTFLEFSKHDLGRQIIPLPPLPEQQKIAEILSTVDEQIKTTQQIIDKTRELKKGLMQKLFSEGIGHTRFKQTKIGRVPEAWEVVKMGDLGSFLKGRGISKSDLQDSGVPCIRYGELYTKHHEIIRNYYSFTSADVADQAARLQFGDVLFAGSGETIEEIGKSAAFTSNDEVYAGGDIVILRPDRKDFDAHFLGYSLASDVVQKRKSRVGQGATIMHIYASQLAKIPISLPPLKEQEKIAQICLNIDNRIHAESISLDALRTVKRGLMQELLTGRKRLQYDRASS